jgi:N-acetylmuramoyl-L-alanine amidase
LGAAARGRDMIRQGNTPVSTIFVHCAATRPSWMEGFSLAAKVEEIRRWHIRDRGWKDIGYHWIIDRDGSMAPGRPETVVGAHVQGHNTGSIGVCLIGGHGSNADDTFLEHFTPAQDRALRQLIASIKARTPIMAIRGHNEVAAKACPGFNVAKWLASELRRPVDAPAAPSKPVAAPTPAPAPQSPWAALLRALAGLFRR